MSADFHIFTASDDGQIRVRQEGLYGERVFPDLSTATHHLREATEGCDAFVVIHDGQGEEPNRIPLHLLTQQ